MAGMDLRMTSEQEELRTELHRWLVDNLPWEYGLGLPPRSADLDAEVNHLQVEMLNIAEGYRCSIETDIREVGGAERVW